MLVISKSNSSNIDTILSTDQLYTSVIKFTEFIMTETDDDAETEAVLRRSKFIRRSARARR